MKDFLIAVAIFGGTPVGLYLVIWMPFARSVERARQQAQAQREAWLASLTHEQRMEVYAQEQAAATRAVVGAVVVGNVMRGRK